MNKISINNDYTKSPSFKQPNMKNAKRLGISITMLLFLGLFSLTTNQISAQSSTNLTSNFEAPVLIRIYESFGNMSQRSSIVVTTGTTTKQIDLETSKPSTREANDQVIYHTLLEYLSQGYQIDQLVTSGSSEVCVITTIILSKE